MADPLRALSIPDPIPGVIPACGISLLAGAPGIGKTALLATLLRQFRDNEPIFGHQPSPIPAIGIICVDRSWGTNQLWFERAGYPDIQVYSVADDPSFKKALLRKRADRIKLFSEFIDKLTLPPGSLVVPDPISPFLGGNLIDYDTCMVSCLELREILIAKLITLIGTAHTAKIKSDKNARYLRPQDQILGSAAIFGFTDTQLYLASPEELQRNHYVFLWTPHMSPPETFPLVRNNQGLFVPYSGKDADHNPDRLLQCFPPDGNPISAELLLDRAQAIPLSKATMYRCLEDLVGTGRVLHLKRGLYSKALAS